MKVSNVYGKNLDAYLNKKKWIINTGGTRSTKTWSVLQLLLTIIMKRTNILVTVVSSTYPKLRMGCIRDFETILSDEPNLYKRFEVNKSEHTYRFKDTGSVIEFTVFPTTESAHGGARTILYADEANHISWSIIEQLATRTKEAIFISLNPSQMSWVEEIVQPMDEATTIHSTYKDNPFLTESQVRFIESHKETSPRWWQTYGLGVFSKSEESVYTNWEIYDGDFDELTKNLPEYAYGGDFGWQDPCTLLKVYKTKDTLYLQELIYTQHKTNQEIAEMWLQLGLTKKDKITMDCAEPKSIKEIRVATGCIIQPSVKGKDSIANGIQLIQNYRLVVDKRSTHLIKELDNYSYVKDKLTDNVTEQVIDAWNHLLDPLRYCMSTFYNNVKGKSKAYLV